MPTTYTHYRFGKDVLSVLPNRIQQSIEKNRELFDIGLHGPDILFYYNIFSSNSVSKKGVILHEEPAESFFLRSKEVIEKIQDKAAARAYMYGVICHFALDSECHPYIEKMIQVSGISHSEIEMELDRYLMLEDQLIPTKNTRVEHVKPTKKNANIIAPFYEGVSTEKIRKALKSMIWCHKVLAADNKGKEELIYKALQLAGKYDEFQGLVMGREANTACENYCILLKKVYEEAVPLAVDYILQYQKLLSQGESLPKRFKETFGAGENWENLQL